MWGIVAGSSPVKGKPKWNHQRAINSGETVKTGRSKDHGADTLERRGHAPGAVAEAKPPTMESGGECGGPYPSPGSNSVVAQQRRVRTFYNRQAGRGGGQGRTHIRAHH